ncbi:MFS transporter [Inquilinus sp.]|jgi:MFS family permease|uniref:MFS transporter n=1 Tax=Inquilinus sp. TaxID=1932117 RepID=UPI0037831D6E
MTANRSSGDAEAPSSTRLGFTILAAVQGTLIFTIALIMVPLPKIAVEFMLTSADLLLLQVAYGLPFSGLLLFGGRLADRYGGRRMFVLGLGLFGAASLAAAAAPGFGVLVAARFAQGVGGALTAPAAMAVLRALFSQPAAYGRAMAAWGGVSVLGAILGFVVSGILTTWLSWRWMFAIPVLVALAGLALTRGLLPADRKDASAGRPGLDPIGGLLATAGIVLASYGLIASGEHPWSAAAVWGPLAAGAALLAAFLGVERVVRDPLLPPGFLPESCRMTGLLGMLLAAAGSVLIEFVLSLYLQQARGWTPLATALAFLPFAVALMATNRIAPPLVGRLGPARVTVAGLLIAAAGLGLLAGLDRGTGYAAGLLPGMVFLAAGLSLMFSGSAVLSTMHVPQRQAGLAGGVMNTAMELGPTVGLTALMSVAATRPDAVDGYAWAFGAGGVAFLVMALVAAPLLFRAACAAPQPEPTPSC